MQNDALYALQVAGGTEKHARALIQGILPEDAYSEVFIPRYQKSVRRQGTWQKEKALLTPGYLYIRTHDVDQVNRLLWNVPAFTRLVRSGERIVPLDQADVAWINALTKPNHRTVYMSYGFIEGDKVVVQQGPLQGHESSIVRIDRHKRLAYLELHILGRNKLIQVGLEIIRKL